MLSLIADQKKLLEYYNVSCGIIGERMSMTDEDVASIKNGQHSIVLGSPEALVSGEWQSVLRSIKYSSSLLSIVFDEAHCISDWGSDFRPAYKEACNLGTIANKPVGLLTATCSKRIRDDILKSLGMDYMEQVTLLPDRPNIFLNFTCKSGMLIEELNWLADDIKENGISTEKTILYSPFTSSCSDVYNYLMGKLKMNAYHLGERKFKNRYLAMYYSNIGENTKTQVQAEFSKPDSNIRLLITTVAFGLGVNIPDVTRVVHWGSSKNPESYWQEVGRAGRQGGPATSHLYVVPILYHPKIHDVAFISKLKELGGLRVKQTGVKRSRATQTEESSLAEHVLSTVDGDDSPTPCLRRLILENMVLETMDGLEALEPLTCSSDPETCGLRRCCTFCLKRCTCISDLECLLQHVDLH